MSSKQAHSSETHVELGSLFLRHDGRVSISHRDARGDLHRARAHPTCRPRAGDHPAVTATVAPSPRPDGGRTRKGRSHQEKSGSSAVGQNRRIPAALGSRTAPRSRGCRPGHRRSPRCRPRRPLVALVGALLERRAHAAFRQRRCDLATAAASSSVRIASDVSPSWGSALVSTTTKAASSARPPCTPASSTG